jgi:putative hydrolase of the HAD superfamily
MATASPSRPAAVIFDIGGTILEERWWDLKAALRAVVSDARLIDDLALEFQRVVSEQHSANREVELAGWLLDRLPQISLTLEELEDELWPHIVELVPFDIVSDVLHQLAADRIPVAAISNAPFSARVLSGELERHGLSSHFRFVVSSADLGLRKPDPAIFETALNQLGIGADRVWFVGDTFSQDIVGAHAAGMQAIWLSRDDVTPLPTTATRVQDWEGFRKLYDAATIGREAG